MTDPTGVVYGLTGGDRVEARKENGGVGVWYVHANTGRRVRRMRVDLPFGAALDYIRRMPGYGPRIQTETLIYGMGK